MEHARAAPISRHRVHRTLTLHYCTFALAQDAGEGRMVFASLERHEGTEQVDIHKANDLEKKARDLDANLIEAKLWE